MAKRNTAEGDRLDVLVTLVEAWERKHYSLSRPRRVTVDVIRRALEIAGVEFIGENGGSPDVRLRQSKKPRSYKQGSPTGVHP